jgi:putative zinc finger/helix-turn-helix YgiT family protein
MLKAREPDNAVLDRSKPYPRRCPECGKADVRPHTMPYDAEVRHDGRLHVFRITNLHVDRCGACGEILFTNATDEQISGALREHLRLLSPEEIRERLEALGMTQKEFAERIGVAPESVSRWLTGRQIQSRAMDNLIRLFFRFDNVRSALSGM